MNYRTLVKENRFIYYTAPSFAKKSDFKESFHVAGKILLNRRNYCLIKITQDDRQRKDLKVSEEWKIEKIILNWLINIIIHSKNFKKKFKKIFLWSLGGEGFFGKFFLILKINPFSQGGVHLLRNTYLLKI